MKKYVITCGGNDAEGVDCENAVSFGISRELNLDNLHVATAILEIAKAHSFLSGLTFKCVKQVAVFDEGCDAEEKV